MPFITVPIDGGLDLVTPPVSVMPGRMQDCENFEVALNQGAKSIDGYERFDGGPSPSASARLWLVTVDGLDVDKHDRLVNQYFVSGEVQIGYKYRGVFVGSVTGTIVFTSATSATTGNIYFVTGNRFSETYIPL